MTSEARIPAQIRAVWADFPTEARHLAETLRARIFDCAQDNPAVGRLTETLRWGQAAYLTEETGAGTTLRIAGVKTGGIGLFVHCQSRVVPDVRPVHDRDLTWDGTRGLILSPKEPLPESAVQAMILAALTYRL